MLRRWRCRRCRTQPVAILLADVVLRDAVRIFDGLLGVVFLVDDERRLDDAVLDRLGQRVVAYCPGEVHAVLVLGGGGEVEPERQPVRQGAMDSEQRLAPGQLYVVDVVRLIIEDNQIL